MMKAIEFQFKSHDHKIVDNVPKPSPGKDEVLIKVVYSALDTAHQPILEKEFPTAYFIHKVNTKKTPLYLGYHYSGIIESIGSDVTDANLKEGVAVFGFLQYEPSQSQGTFAEYITVKQNDCAMKPNDVSFEIAAASTTEAITALQAIRDKGGLRMRSESNSKSKEQKQQNILIVGAAGGVGSAAVQIAKHLLNAHVTAVCGSKDVQTVKEVYGADVVIDRTVEPNYMKRLLNENAKFDVILDAPSVLPALATKLLKPKGVIVTTLPTGTLVWNMLKLVFSSKKATWVECRSNRDDLSIVGSMLSNENKLNIPIDSTFKVKDMAAAMAKQAGKKNGRVVIQVEKGWN